MMGTWAIYDATGFITKVYTGTQSCLAVMTSPGEASIAVSPAMDAQKYYVVSGVITLRPVMNLVVPSVLLAVDTEFQVTGIPAGTTVNYPGGTIVINDGFLEWESAIPGAFQFTFNKFPYRTEVVYAEVTEA